MSSRLALVVALLASASAGAQPERTLSDDAWCEETYGWDKDRDRACEVRETVISAARLDVDAGPNGGVKVKTWDREDILIRSRVAAAGRTEADAERFVRQTDVRARNGRVSTDLPETNGDGWVTVSFEVFVPRETDLALRSLNGGLAVDGVAGDIEAEALNGGIALRGVGGAVRVRAMNGGVTVSLAGDAWEGQGLDVETTNGGIAIELPRDYSARLDAQTRVGRISTDGLPIPRTRDRRGYVGDRVEATLGSGGAPLRLRATNGGMTIRRGR